MRTKWIKLSSGVIVGTVLWLSVTGFCQETATARDPSNYDGPKRPFDPKPLMEKLRADPARQTGPFTFVCVSDREFGVQDFDDVARRAEKVGFDFCVLTGDIVHRGAGEEGITDYGDLERESGWFLAGHPCWPVLGNHEIGKKTSIPGQLPDADGFERWKAFYGMPDDWYSFTYRNNLFIVIGLMGDLTATQQRQRVEVYLGRHMAWLEEQLKAGQGMDNIFVFQHLPLFSVGIHEDNPNHPMVDLCAKYNVTAVVCGHDHHYYRAFRRGVSYLLSAGGGGSLYDLTFTDRALPGDVYLGGVKAADGKSRRYVLHHPARGEDKTYDKAPYFFLAFTVDGRKVSVRAITAGGEEIDATELRDAQGRNVGPETPEPGSTPYIPVVGNDWQDYESTEELRAAELFWWFRRDANANDLVDLVPDETFGQVARITFEANTGTQGHAPRMLTKLPEPLDRCWFRWRVKFSPGWTTAGPDPAGHANSYKLAFWLWEGYDGRGQIEFSNTRQYILGCNWNRPGENSRPEEQPLPGSQSFGHVTNEWTDGEWYEFVIYYERRRETVARQHWWRRRLTEQGAIVDLPFMYNGMELADRPAPRVRAVELGANKNKNNPTTMYLYWGPWEVVDGSRFPDPFGLLPR